MGVLQGFALPEEYESILQDMKRRHDLVALYKQGNSILPLPSDAPLILNGSALRTRLFLAPESIVESTVPRYWIDIDVGQLVHTADRKILTLTTIQGSTHAGLPFKAGALITSLRNRLKKVHTFGVLGANIVHGGSCVYNDMWYSQEAWNLYKTGVKWKQYATDNCEFSPL
jgi:hypothetical protein